MLRNIVLKLSLVLVGIFIGVGSLEVVIRVVHPQIQSANQVGDPVLLWKRKPNAKFRVKNVSGEWVDVKINEEGFRTRSFHSLPPAPRIVFLGDSFLEGLYAPENCLFVNRVEARLRETLGREAVCLNLGIAGYGPDQETILYSRVASAVRPDTVVLAYFGGNDLENVALQTLFTMSPDGRLISNAEGRPVTLRTRMFYAVKNFFLHDMHLFSAIIQPLSNNAAVVRLLTRLGVIHVDIDAVAEKGAAFTYNKEQYASVMPPRVDAAWKKMARVLELLQQRTRAHGASLMILYIPHEQEVSPEKWTKFAEETRTSGVTSPPDSGMVERALGGIAGSLHIPFVSLSPVFRQEYRARRIYIENDGHWTCDGQDLAAKAFLAAAGPNL